MAPDKGRVSGGARTSVASNGHSHAATAVAPTGKSVPVGSTKSADTTPSTPHRSLKHVSKPVTSHAPPTTSSLLGPDSRVEKVRRRTGVGYVGLNISAEDLETRDLSETRGIVWFDIDNTLYHKSTRIADLMGKRILAYFLGLGLPEDEAKALHQKYYREHGLAIRGLLKNHAGIDPLDYDMRVDGSLPLDDILKPEEELTTLVRDIDRSKVRVFAATNAYKNHGLRCIKLLGLEDYFDGIVYCDYSAGPLFCCKPDKAYYEAAAEIVGVSDTTKFYFVDDSEKNIVAAKEMGWRSAVLYFEPDEVEEEPSTTVSSSHVAVNGTGGDHAALTTLSEAISSTSSDGLFDAEAIKAQVRSLTKRQRISLLSIILDAAMPGDLLAMRQTLERHLRSTRDVVSHLPDTLALRFLERLDIKDLIACRLVSKRWHALTKRPELWRSHALALTEGDPEPVRPPADEAEWENLVKGLYFRERNWSLGLAQTVQFCKGHTGFVTSMKLRGRTTLVTGSYDGSIRVWDLAATPSPACTRVIKADKIACLDFMLEPSVIAAGLYDTGRILVFDFRTGELLHTLSGHNKGIRNVALNEQYLVSVGQDKAICVWDYRSGERVVRFGQQSNVSLGVCLVDTDKLVAVTIDGVIRSFSIRSKKMIGEFQLSKLGRTDAKWAALMKEFSGESGMLSWFAAHRNSITVGSKSLVAHLEWREHVIPTQRMRRDSSQSTISTSGSFGPTSNSRQRSDSMTSNASTVSTRTTTSRAGSGFTPRSSINGSTSPSTQRVSSRASLGSSGSIARASAPRRSLGTPSRTPGATNSPQTPARALPASTSLSKLSSNTSTPVRQTTPSSSTTSFPSYEADDSLDQSLTSDTTTSQPTHRIAPNLTVAPRVVSVLRTPEVATGAVDPLKRRLVCSSRFSARVGAERTLYTSTYSDPAQSGNDTVQDGTHAPESPETASTFPTIRGAWSAHSNELSIPERNPMSIVLDHESVVVGTSDGLVYR